MVARSRASLLALAVASLVALVIPVGPVHAALFLILEPDHGSPGARIAGRTAGDGAFRAQVDPLPTFLVETGGAAGVVSPDDAALVEVGRLVIDSRGNGRIEFVVPELEPGTYAVMLFCTSCAATSGGRTIVGVAELEILPPLPGTDTPEPRTGSGAPGGAPLALVAAAMAVASLVVAVRGPVRRP